MVTLFFVDGRVRAEEMGGGASAAGHAQVRGQGRQGAAQQAGEAVRIHSRR